MMKLALAGLMVAACPALAQLEPWIDLAGDWRVKFEDRQEFSRSDFDDHTWELFRLPSGEIASFQRGPGWLRKRVQLPESADRSQLALTLGTIQNVYEVYVNGQRIGASGDFHSFAESQIARPLTFYIPAAAVPETGRLQIAIRAKQVLYEHPDWEMEDRGPYVVSTRARAPVDAGVREFERWRGVLAPSLAFGIVYSLFALVSLLAYWSDQARKELFWFAMVCCGYVFNDFYCLYQFSVDSRPFNSSGVAYLVVIFGTLMYPLFAQFAASSFGYKSWWLRAGLWLGWSLVPIHILFRMDHVFGTLWGCSCASVLAAAMVLWHWRQGINGKQVISWHAFHLALLVQAVGYVELWVLPILQIPSVLPWAIHVGPYRMNREDTLWILASTAIMVLLIRSVAIDRRDRQRLVGELHAARVVQQLLIGTGEVDVQTWKVETEYVPAQEVGGDFYQLFPGNDGSLLLVTGDVSGKGLQAAMLVATIVGALGNLASRKPAEVLMHLNACLRGKSRGGFVTCCCANFDANGSVTIANAGNPSPYCDGHELELEAGLPLGVVAGVEYEELVFSGDRFTFVSDGVVEADNGNLFGFDRTREISGKPAAEIAAAAKAWGQNDDITVVTVRRAS